MSVSPSDDKLPESFFASLYPAEEPARPAPEPLGFADPTRLSRLIEQWPAAVLCLDTQLRCVLANREARGWWRPEPLSAVDPLPRAVHELLDDSLLEALLPYLSAALRGMELEFEDRFQHPRQGERWVSIRVQPEHEDARVVGVFLHLQDRTDLRHATLQAEADRALQDAGPATDHDAHLRMLAEGLRDAAIFFLDAHGHVSDWTPSAERLFGVSREDMLGQPVHRFAPDAIDGEDPMVLGMERAALLGQSETPGWQVRADGSRFWANTLLTALHDDATGEACGYACLMRDTTEVKRLLDLLQSLNQELEQRVEDRTRQLQAMNQDLEAFSYSVSHDLRAPLRHIASFVDLLREDLGTAPPPDALRHLGTIEEAARHMGALIEGLLAFSKLGRASLHPRPVPMAALLRSSINRVQHDPALQRAPGTIEWRIADDLPAAHGDSLLLSQVWDNLLSNALKYSRPRETAQIAVGWQTERQAGEADRTVYWVRDNGVGFNPQRAERLFGVFQRLHRPKDFEGTGIGLALCRRIVERHGGRIWAESTPDEGSTFYFSLPQAPASDASAAPLPALAAST